MAALSPVREDPAIEAGYAAKATYTARLREIRDDFDLSPLVKAEQLAAAHEKLLTELDRLRTDLHGRRTTRLAVLEGKVPLGPGVPAGTSPADRAVLTAAFRSALDKALGATSAQARKAMLIDAQKYDDDSMRRGVLTAAFELGELEIASAWITEHTNFRDKDTFLEELRTLRGQLAGTIPTDRMWEGQALGEPQRPQEMANLPTLRAQRDALAAQQRRLPPGTTLAPAPTRRDHRRVRR